MSALVVHPSVGFASLEEALTALGWQRERDAPGAAPLLMGEPEIATFARDGARIVYTFDPIVRLRLLAVHGDEASVLDLAAHLPVLDARAIRALAASAEMQDKLLAVHAVDELAATELVDVLVELASDVDPRVARTATRVLDHLRPQLLARGIESLREEKERAPDRSVLFRHIGGPEQKRQILRWLVRDLESSNRHVEDVLRTALEDEDWEVRATAMIAAVRLRAPALVPLIRSAPLPTTTRAGADQRERRFLERLRAAVLDELQVRPRPPEGEGNEPLRQVLDRAGPIRSELALFVYSMTTPLGATELPTPPTLPEGVVAGEQAITLKRTGLQLAWLPPVEHWIGEDGGASPVRIAVPAQGTFVAVQPLTRGLALRLFGDVPWVRAAVADDEQMWLASLDEARAACAALSQLEGVPVDLPAADEWECAVRSPDGRRYAWGNGLVEDASGRASPWGVRGLFTAEEWTQDVAADGTPVVVGGQRRPAERWLGAPSHRAVRPVFRVR